MAKTKKVEEQQEQTQSEEQKKQSQVYDTSMKDLIDRQAKDILPVLLPGLTYQETLNIEIVKPVLRSDKVYLVMYQGKQHSSSSRARTSVWVLVCWLTKQCCTLSTICR